jgi:arylsulfatase A-like enzyme
LIVWTRSARAARIKHRVSGVDLLPTLLMLLGMESDVADLDGRAVLDARGNDFLPVAREGPVVLEMLVQERAVVRAILEGEWKYHAAQTWVDPERRPQLAKDEAATRGLLTPDAIDIWGPVVHEELYNVYDDRDELHDRSIDGPIDRMRALHEDYRRRCARDSFPRVLPAPSDTGDPQEHPPAEAPGAL